MHYLKETHPVRFMYNMSKYILEHGTKYGDLIECRNFLSDIEDYEETKETQIMHDKFIEIFGDERLNWAKKVTFIEPRVERDPLADYEYYVFDCLPKSEKKDSYYGRLTGQCGGFERNQFEHLINRMSKNRNNAKTLQMVVYSEKDIWNEMGPPCCISINVAPRDGVLNLTANFRSMALSKAGYADAQAVYEMGKWLAEEMNYEMGTVSLFAHSSHLRSKNGEMKKTKDFIEAVEKCVE